jgi:2-polyprenyl-6-methoxyphenol hydroxylase-like FAD-dependent oxidoreductase
MHDTDVLVVGAGPTGLVLALWLTRLGIRVRIVDRTSGLGTTSQALNVQARTLELYRQLGLSDAVVAAGYASSAFGIWADGEQRARMPFDTLAADLTPFPFVLNYSQDAHERLLLEQLSLQGVIVQRETEFTALTQDAQGVRATLRGSDGSNTGCTAAYLAGCDGAHSQVREVLGIRLPGGADDRLLYVADIEGKGAAINGDVNIFLGAATEFLAVFPHDAVSRVRLVGTVRNPLETANRNLTFDDIGDTAARQLGITTRRVNGFTTHRLHHRVAERYKVGRAFLLGDAGHVHSPVGGQGMNTGIGDSINLAWKLAAVIGGRADQQLLDTYEAERIAFARRLVSMTDRIFSVAMSASWLARQWRMRMAPFVLAALGRVNTIGRLNFRTVSQLALNYRDGPLSSGKAGSVRGGDRLPWVKYGEHDNHEPLVTLNWQVHAYGRARPALHAWCRDVGAALHVFPWQAECQRAGFAKDSAYLVRPDGYIAIAARNGAPAAFDTNGPLIPVHFGEVNSQQRVKPWSSLASAIDRRGTS